MYSKHLPEAQRRQKTYPDEGSHHSPVRSTRNALLGDCPLPQFYVGADETHTCQVSLFCILVGRGNQLKVMTGHRPLTPGAELRGSFPGARSEMWVPSHMLASFENNSSHIICSLLYTFDGGLASLIHGKVQGKYCCAKNLPQCIIEMLPLNCLNSSFSKHLLPIFPQWALC